ncbi:aminotransferase class I/II-fold pyridoxal phosphate-dependent enzyme [Salinicoccus sp. CNSTN-B1]
MFGVAGLRIGIAIGEGEAFRRITRINHPYPVNALSLNIASRIFEDREALEAFIEYQLESKRQLAAALGNISDEVAVLESSTNFIFTYGEHARDLGHFMKTRGYQPRMYDTAPLDEAVRYSIIKHEDYDRFNQLIKEWSNRHDQQGTHDKRNGNLNSTR